MLAMPVNCCVYDVIEERDERIHIAILYEASLTLRFKLCSILIIFIFIVVYTLPFKCQRNSSLVTFLNTNTLKVWFSNCHVQDAIQATPESSGV